MTQCSELACRDKTRDRLKLIARVVNVEQWAKEGPLSGYEHSLLNNYNDKPILTRPQQQFFSGDDYLEVDLDVHTYAWLARKAFANFIPRLGESLRCICSLPKFFTLAISLWNNAELEMHSTLLSLFESGS